MGWLRVESGMVGRGRAVVIGAGIGGLTAARALVDVGWSVTVLERAPEVGPVGSGIGIGPNALRALDVLGDGDAIRARSAAQTGGLRRWDGRWLVRTDMDAVRERFGDIAVILRRAEVIDVLRRSLPDGALRTSTAVAEVDPGDVRRPARVRTETGEGIDADLVVAADGVNSRVRRALFPRHPGPVFAYPCWWVIAPAPEGAVLGTESWGVGRVAGLYPLADGDVYAYFTDSGEPGQHEDDERAGLLRRFGAWHDPIPQVIATAEHVIRNDVWSLRTPLPAFHRGRVALLGDAAHAMAPNLGQGACQAIEDGVTLAHLVAASADIHAGLAEYTRLRLPRTNRIVRRSGRIGGFLSSTSPVLAAGRDALVTALGRLAPGGFLRSFDEVFDWTPPRPTEPTR
ncbi:FAD-dependent monooxygenase [Nocardiopsis rhodophaea]|uniref:FAD-dependent monooxygenase n=1 Tax=Nocardiopsis rhodophaea TaxID=280238 RepID=A0ABP5EYS7_9ACTN